MIPYTLLRSRRKTVSMEIRRDLSVVVRAPLRMPQREIDAFVAKHQDWLRTHIAAAEARLANHPEPTPEREAELRALAKAVLPERVAYYSRVMGLTPAGITITGARTRFGSCSPKNRLSFSWRLMDYPEEVIDYVVVHELAHIVHKNHSPAFHALVERYLPDHRRRRALLRK